MGRFALCFLVLGCALVAGQDAETPDLRPGRGASGDIKLPDGRSQRDAILKADHEKSLRDADELVRLSEEVRADLDKNDQHVLSVATLKKLDELEKLTRRIRGRMKRF